MKCAVLMDTIVSLRFLSIKRAVLVDRMDSWAVLSMKTGISVDARTRFKYKYL